MRSSAIVFVPLLLASYVSAHGFLFRVTVGDQTNTGSRINRNGEPNSAIRQVTTPEPLTGANNPALTCGAGARPAPQVLDANPGDNLLFDWKGADLSNWPHNTGPMITWLASCGDRPCNEFNAANARWFKVHEVGRKRNSGEWVQADLMQGRPAQATLPTNLAPGNYLLRHEIIALHLATRRGGAEYYPACVQIRVRGSGTGRPRDNELVSHPGIYRDDAPGIFVPDVFSSTRYAMPGGPLPEFVTNPGSGGGNNGNGGNSTQGGDNRPSSTRAGNPAPTNAGSAPVPDATSNNSSGSSTRPKQICKAKKRSINARSEGELYPRHFSRVMRRMFGSAEFERRAALPASH